MEPIYRFQHLDITRCFPTHAADWWRCEPFVPPRGRQGLVASAVLSDGEVSPPLLINSCAVGVLYVCVLHAPLFRAVPPGKICNVLDLDSRSHPRAFVCADWAALLDRLVDIFAAHEERTSRYHLAYAENRLGMYEALTTLLDVYKDFLARSKTPGGRWRPRVPKSGRVRGATMLKAFELFEGLMDSMYGPESVSVPVTFIPFQNLRVLMQRLDDTLQHFGPQRRPGHQYAQSARHAAVFHLLEHFGLVEPRASKKGQRWVSDILRS